MTTSEATSRTRLRLERWLVPLCALFVGGVVRLTFVLRSDYPLNDGGLFYLMAKELQRAGYHLPAYTAYNGAGIPFAYPPLGLYMAGLAASVGPWSLVDVFRFLPFVFSVLSIPAFYALARALLPEDRAAAVAVFAFALLPGSFASQIMGGGVTRAPGLLFAILAVGRAHALYTRPRMRHALTTGLLMGLAALSHLAMAWLGAVSIGLLFLTFGRSRKALLHSLLAAAVAAAVSAPWWGVVLARHGLAPFLAAGRSPEPTFAGLFQLATLTLTGEPGFPLLGALALLGVIVYLARRRFLLPAWLAAVFLLDPRTARATATLPLALLAGVGVVEGLLPALSPPRVKSSRLAGAVVALAFVYALCSALAGPASALHGLSGDERAAMRWVAENTPPSSTFLVLTGSTTWGADRTSEWFPVLAERVSVGTVQGQEWFDGFLDRAYAYTQLQACAAGDAADLEAWARQVGVSYTHVYVARPQPGGKTLALAEALRCQVGYGAVYDGPGAVVYQRALAGQQGGD